MRNIIELLYKDELDPHFVSLRADSKLHQSEERLQLYEESLRGHLEGNETALSLLHNLIEAQFNQSTQEAQHEYIAGFRLGALLLLDVLRPLL